MRNDHFGRLGRGLIIAALLQISALVMAQTPAPDAENALRLFAAQIHIGAN